MLNMECIKMWVEVHANGLWPMQWIWHHRHLAFLEKLKLYFLIKILFLLYKICHLILTSLNQVWYSTMCMGASMESCQIYLIGGVGFVAYSMANCTCGNACKSAWEEGNDVHEQKEKHKKILTNTHTERKLDRDSRK